MKNTFTNLLFIKKPPHTRRNIKALIMRISQVYILFITSTIIAVASPRGNGQSIETTTVELEIINEPLKNVFQKIEAQTEFLFHWNDKVNNYTSVILPKGSYTVKDVLDIVLQGTELKYDQKKNYIVILLPEEGEINPVEIPGKENDRPHAPFTALVTGTVRDVSTQELLTGVNIIVKGTTRGTTTDVEGKFSIQANENDVLIFSFIGFKSFEFQIKGRLAIDVSMERDATDLKEIEINAGYWQVSKKESTGNISRISAEEIQKQPILNPLQALQGRMPGVFIQQVTGVPGGFFKVQIRGRNSIDNGNDPLYIIDGVPFVSESLSSTRTSVSILGPLGSSPLNSVNPSDIESIEILKDADATAIYGSRASNGVVLITTKRGISGRTKFDANIYTGVSNVFHKIELLNTQQYIEIRKEAFINDGIASTNSNAQDLLLWDTTRYTDWQEKLIGGTAHTTNAQISISGGDAGTQFLFGGGYQKQNTVFPGESLYHKLATHFSVTHTSSNKRMKAELSASYVADKNSLMARDLTSQALTLAPNAPVLHDVNGNLNWENSTWTNPLSYLEQKYKANTNNLIANVGLGYDLLPGLQIKANLGYNDIRMRDSNGIPSTIFDPSRGLNSEFAEFHLNNNSSRSWIIEPQTSWQKKLFSGQLKILIGTTLQQQVKEQLVQMGTGFSSDALIEDIDAASSVTVRDYVNTAYHYNAVFGRVNYNWQEKYLLNITARRDGSSRFGPGKQLANFGAVGVGWVFSKMEFIKRKFQVLSFGKLRASYGITGNDQIGDYEFLNTYESTGAYHGVVGLVPTRLFNPDFAWEVNRKLEAALEIGFLDDHILIATSYFRNRSSNQLVGYPLAKTTGFDRVRDNLPAIVQNSGLEIEARTINFSQNDINWVSSMNLTFPRNRLIAFPGLDGSTYASAFEVGESLNISKVYHYLGVDTQSGIYQFEDMNGDGVLSSADRLVIKELGQEYYGGINNSFSFKGFQLDVFFQFVKQTGLSYWYAFSSYPGARNTNLPKMVLDRWQSEGDEATVQRVTRGSDTNVVAAFNNHKNSDASFTDASFIRLKNVSLSYKFPYGWTKGIDCRLYLQGQNLLTITNYDGLDPENYNAATLPPLMTITAGVQFTF